MIWQTFPYHLQFYLQVRLAYSCHYIKERKFKRFSYLRMKLIKLMSSRWDSSNLLVVEMYSVVALRICVLLCASTEKFLKKAFLSRRFRSYVAICNQWFYTENIVLIVLMECFLLGFSTNAIFLGSFLEQK